MELNGEQACFCTDREYWQRYGQEKNRLNIHHLKTREYEIASKEILERLDREKEQGILKEQVEKFKKYSNQGKGTKTTKELVPKALKELERIYKGER
jgi:hypothetical protein